MNEHVKINNIKTALIVCLLWLVGLFAFGNIAYAQAESETYTPVEILMSEPELTDSSPSSSLFNQAKKYHDGNGVAQDLLRAHTLYLKAADMGNNHARINLGYLYFMGEGVEQSYSKARNWYLTAAKNGSKDAQSNLAMIYQNGFGVPKDKIKAEFWRTYKQEKPIQKDRVKTASTAKKPVQTKPLSTKSTVKKKTVNTPIKSVANPIRPKKLPLIVERVTTQNMEKGNTQIAANTAPIITVPTDNKDIPRTKQLTPQAFVSNTVKNDVTPISDLKSAAEIPKTELIIFNAQLDANESPTEVESTIAELNEETSLPTIRSLRRAPLLNDKQPYILSQWVSNIIGAMMLALVIMTSGWFFSQYTEIGKRKKARVFARAFYAHHRDRLRVNYLRYPMKHRKIDTMDDSWAAALCVLMVKFALSQKNEDTLVGMQSNKIIQALKESPFKAKLAVFPFVKVTQLRIFDDIEAHEHNFKENPGVCEEPQRVKTKEPAPKVKIKDVLTVEKTKEFSPKARPIEVLENNYPKQVKLHSDSAEKQKNILGEDIHPNIEDSHPNIEE